ncbi:hypothetical protein EYF80_046291 [Liparis tanakae]|uniref:Uncharacterized protein n=1 Tax=Liparis tanakae TaxID=230148 RepID=A0A4Z2FQM0_9TELE|nr:hypothetical protein EYF80_046291 [Liparis tanakae]
MSPPTTSMSTSSDNAELSDISVPKVILGDAASLLPLSQMSSSIVRKVTTTIHLHCLHVSPGHTPGMGSCNLLRFVFVRRKASRDEDVEREFMGPERPSSCSVCSAQEPGRRAGRDIRLPEQYT